MIISLRAIVDWNCLQRVGQGQIQTENVHSYPRRVMHIASQEVLRLRLVYLPQTSVQLRIEISIHDMTAGQLHRYSHRSGGMLWLAVPLTVIVAAAAA